MQKAYSGHSLASAPNVRYKPQIASTAPSLFPARPPHVHRGPLSSSLAFSSTATPIVEANNTSPIPKKKPPRHKANKAEAPVQQTPKTTGENKTQEALKPKELYMALRKGTTKSIRRILDTQQVDVNRPIQGRATPFEIIVQTQKIPLVKDMIQRGADVNRVNARGEVPLHIAVKTGNLELCTILLASGANIAYRYIPQHPQSPSTQSQPGKGLRSSNDLGLGAVVSHKPSVSDGMSPLMLACTTFHGSIVDRLLEFGAPIDQTDNNGRTALMYAAQYSSRTIIESLHRHNADISLYDNFGQCAHDYSYLHKSPNMPQILSLCFSNRRVPKSEYLEQQQRQAEDSLTNSLKQLVLNDDGSYQTAIIDQVKAKMERIRKLGLPSPDKVEVIIAKENDPERHFIIDGTPKKQRTKTTYTLTTMTIDNAQEILNDPGQYVLEQNDATWHQKFHKVKSIPTANKGVKRIVSPFVTPPAAVPYPKSPVPPKPKLQQSLVSDPVVDKADKSLHSSLLKAVNQVKNEVLKK